MGFVPTKIPFDIALQAHVRGDSELLISESDEDEETDNPNPLHLPPIPFEDMKDRIVEVHKNGTIYNPNEPSTSSSPKKKKKRKKKRTKAKQSENKREIVVIEKETPSSANEEYITAQTPSKVNAEQEETKPIENDNSDKNIETPKTEVETPINITRKRSEESTSIEEETPIKVRKLSSIEIKPTNQAEELKNEQISSNDCSDDITRDLTNNIQQHPVNIEPLLEATIKGVEKITSNDLHKIEITDDSATNNATTNSNQQPIDEDNTENHVEDKICSVFWRLCNVL